MSIKFKLIAAAALAGAVSNVSAADIFVVHGINGTDLGLPGAELPVDVSVNGACALTDLRFKDIEGPIELDPGQYDIRVSLSDGACGGALAVSSSVNVQFGENASIVAHVTEQSTPTLTRFVNDVRETSRSNLARISIRHAAAAPRVDVRLRGRRYYDRTTLRNLGNGEGRDAQLRTGHYRVYIRPDGARSIGPVALDIAAGSFVAVYAVGSLEGGTFEPLPQVIPLP